MKKQQPVCVEDKIEQRTNTALKKSVEIFVKRLTNMALDKSNEHIWCFKIAQILNLYGQDKMKTIAL